MLGIVIFGELNKLLKLNFLIIIILVFIIVWFGVLNEGMVCCVRELKVLVEVVGFFFLY